MLVLQSRGQLTNFDRNWALTNIEWGGGGMCQQFCPGLYLFHCDFSSCSESTKIWHADSFCVLFVWFFFQESRHAFNSSLAAKPFPLAGNRSPTVHSFLYTVFMVAVMSGTPKSTLKVLRLRYSFWQPTPTSWCPRVVHWPLGGN